MRLAIVLSLFFLFRGLYGGLVEDQAKLQTIVDTKSCLTVFRQILEERLALAESGNLNEAYETLHALLARMDSPQILPSSLLELAWELYPAFSKAYAQLNGFAFTEDSTFSSCGFIQGELPPSVNDLCIRAFEKAKAIPFVAEDCDPNYLPSEISGVTEEILNSSHIYLMFEEEELAAIQAVLTHLGDSLTSSFGYPWRVASVRAWKTPPHAAEQGPNAWHTDGLPPSVLKVMLYPYGASLKKGGVQLQLPSAIHTLEGGPGTWILFKNSAIPHRGLAPQEEERLGIEISLIPALSINSTPLCAGNNARHPLLPWSLPTSFRPIERGIDRVNLGGGPYWNSPGWINLEGVASPINPRPFLFHPNCRLPFEKETLKLVYTSHALEHLDLPTVYRLFAESYRTLEKGGDLVIVIPDYDKALKCWHNREPDFFFNRIWNIESVTPSWKHRKVCDCLDHRAAMIFSSFFNDAYGNPFAGSTPTKTGYFGPPVLPATDLRKLAKSHSPSQVAQALRKEIRRAELRPHFCHQSAWSRSELEQLLAEFGFEVISFDPDAFPSSLRSIPGLYSMRAISTFCWAKRL